MEGQWELNRNPYIPVTEGDLTFDLAWAGGLNSPQWSQADLDLNGTLDLFVFDRIGDRAMVLLNSQLPGSNPQYTHDVSLLEAFPEMSEWALLKDMDCDGKEDLLTAASNGMTWYRNTSTPGNLSFELADELVQASYNLSGSPFDATLFCLSVDVPSVVDYEGDGDLDIFTWSDAATTIFFFKNMAVENGDCSTPEYICANRCYGKLGEASEDFTIFIGNDFECPFNVIDPRILTGEQAPTRSRHAGGAILQLDLDQNGLLDLVLSDVTDPSMTALLMGECPDGQDSATTAFDNFPAPFMDTEPVDLRVFPAGYYLDVTGDGTKDLLVSPNNIVGTEDNESVWFYTNNGQDDLPDFDLTSTAFLQHEMLDFGRGAYPVAFDENGDGLMDLVVSNKEYNEDVDQQPSQLALLRNVGTADAPAFDLIDANWLNLPQYGVESVYPAFGDLDDDGDLDLILGEETGILHFFRNNATGAVADFALEIPNIPAADGGNLDVGQFSTPQLWDCNGDDLLDLLVGEKNGNVNYIENVGTATDFSFEHQIDTIGDVVASNFLGINGYSVPHMYINPEGQWELLIGSEVGYTNRFGDVQGNFESTFTTLEEVFFDIWEGTYAAPLVYDFNQDDTLDYVVGNRAGGLSYFQGGEVVVNLQELGIPKAGLNVYPNPGNQQLTVELPAFRNGGLLEIYTLQGRLVGRVSTLGVRHTVDTAALPAGCYLINWSYQGERFSARWVKQE